MESGGWLVGADANTIGRVDDLRVATDGIALCDLLGGRFIAAPPGKPRCLAILGDTGAPPILVDRTLGSATLEARDMAAVPPTLRHFGAPPWWIGTCWHDARLVLLLDLAAALRATRQGQI